MCVLSLSPQTRLLPVELLPMSRDGNSETILLLVLPTFVKTKSSDSGHTIHGKLNQMKHGRFLQLHKSRISGDWTPLTRQDRLVQQ